MWFSKKNVSIESIDRELMGLKSSPRRLWVVCIAVVAVIVLVVFVTWVGWSLLSSPATTANTATAEIPALLKKIGRHILLPNAPDPMVATIENAESLRRDQVFFTNAQNGDRLVVYPSLALIYREAEDLLVNVGSVHLPTTSPASAGVGSADGQVVTQKTIEIRNGSSTVGAGRAMANRLLNVPGVIVASIGDAARHNYQGTTVVADSSIVDPSLLAFLGVGAVATLPVGESPPVADILIIIGNQ